MIDITLVFQIKQRIIDVDTKNSIGLLGHIEELSHNALAVYWNPLESPAKVNLAIQCLSTDFRSAISNNLILFIHICFHIAVHKKE